MYIHRQYTRSVRDGAPPYGEAAVPSEEFPGAGALQDLATAAESEVPLVLARYAALRAWALLRAGERTDVVRHAMTAALEHLAAIGDAWPEKGLLREALLREARLRETLPSLDLLRQAAARADSLGHRHGARSLRESVHRAGGSLEWVPPRSLS